jgi:hypothetical protein
MIHETVRLMPKSQWRPQETADARNMELPLRKAIVSEQSQPKRESTWAAKGSLELTSHHITV